MLLFSVDLSISLCYNSIRKDVNCVIMVYLIDTENVGKTWLELLEICKNDKFILFYTKNTGGYSLEMVSKIISSKCNVECISCDAGPNALDFQLVTELGMKAAKSPKTKYIVVSSDKGFDAAIHYMNRKGYLVERLSLVGDVSSQNNAPDKQREVHNILSETEILTQKVASRIPKSAVTKTVKLLIDAKKVSSTKRKNHICNTLRSMFGQENGLQYYRQIKGLIE